ncbi:MAG TPA: ribosome recycling factor [Terriglobia bacterium]|jgi:ribosome recycling factor|nr:ribosome recycling factor [Terriglobia bacterium]
MPTIENPAVRDDLTQAKTRMTKALEDCRHELAGVRTGRASVSMLDPIRVDYYGTPTPISQVATIGIPEPALLTVQPWDASLIAAIEKAIRSSDLGLNPMSDGKMLRVPIPALTEERRKDLVKHLHKVLENHRTAIRNIRRDSNDALKKLLKDKKISEDDEKRGLDEIQKATDDFIAKLDAQGKTKEREILEMK